MPQYENLVKEALDYAKTKGKTLDEQVSIAMDKLAVTFGKEILKTIPGRVSTELDARLSYDKQACIDKAKVLYKMYEGKFFLFRV